MKTKILAVWLFLRNHLLFILAMIAIGMFAAVEVQKYFDYRQIENQTKQIQQFDEQNQQNREETQKLLGMFNLQHESTQNILGAITAVNGTIAQLGENDRRQETEVKNLKEQYSNARNPNQKTKTNTVYLNARRNLPLRQREDDILANDTKLYPKSASR